MAEQRVVDVRRLGHTQYPEANRLMQDLQQQRLLNEIPDTLLFCSHPEIVTMGPAARRDQVVVPADYPTTDVDRGGGITWHGPGQLVVYPIFKWDLGGEANVKLITSKLENWVISSLAILGIQASTDERMQGVWVEGAKVGSVGLAFKRWVSRHGFTVNYATPKGRVEALDGCGLVAGTTTSLDRLSFEISGDEMIEALLSNMPENLSRTDAKS
ncbi:MAG TPA: lipoyl(octanoyl) transferase LipB [Candidatus Thalassarchaeaceae archaeon]|jgi:lipoate-protein ligase B|nr:lipoyl(octanoyl) transferase LipB [Candidatus Thalassarchaeaceae archaeon]HJM67430.1 lipoyl(octanoyl) transferase LipB [Candidatus Thalassarchaeaceae archaeon]